MVVVTYPERVVIMKLVGGIRSIYDFKKIFLDVNSFYNTQLTTRYGRKKA